MPRLVLAVVAAWLVLLPCSAWSQTPFTYRWEASSGRPPDGASECWTPIMVGSGSAMLTGGRLVLSTTSESHQAGYHMTASQCELLFPGTTVIEFRARFVSGTHSLVSRDAMMVAVTTSPGAGTLFGIGQDRVFLNVGSLSTGPIINVDTDGAMHTYRLVIHGTAVGSPIEVYHDNTLILTGSTYGTDFGSDPGIDWGELSGAASGISEWEYFEHNAASGICKATPNTYRWTASSGHLPSSISECWDPILVGSGAAALPGGLLVLSTTSESHQAGYEMTASQCELLFPGTTVIEFRARFVSGTHSLVSRDAMMVGVTTSPGAGTLFGIGQDRVFLNIANVTTGPIITVDTDGALHTYRLVIRGTAVGSPVEVYYDNTLVLTGSVYAHGTDFGSVPGILWGELSAAASGTSEWEYFEHNAAIGTCGTATGPCIPTPSGIVSWWPGDGSAADLRGGNHGSLVSGAAFAPGLVGAAFNFDGIDDYVEIPDSPSLDPTSAMTITAWLRPVEAKLQRVVTKWGVPGFRAYNLDIGADGVVYFYTSSNGSAYHQVNTGPNMVPVGQWSHVACVFDGGSSQRIYVNGVLQATIAGGTEGLPSSLNDSASPLRFARNFNDPPTPFYFHGLLDEVALYQRALTAVEIAAIHAAGAAGGCKDSGPPSVTAPDDTSYQCASQVPAATPEQATATDDQGVTSFTVIEASNGGAGSPSNPLVLTRTWTASDGDGNTASDSQVITVIDNTSPVLAIPADIATTTGPGIEPCAQAHVALETGSATATDNCGISTITVSGAPEGSLFPVGETLLIWTATDAAGNAVRDTQRVVVTCPVGDLAGSASLSCNGQSQVASGVTVHLLHEGSPFLTTTTSPVGAYRFDGLRQGTYTVAIDAPTGYAVSPDTRLVTVDQALETVDPFVFTCLLSDLTGRVTGTCNGQTAGLQGVTVDVFRDDGHGTDVLVATVTTDAQGNYHFDNLALGEYTLGIVLPLGYATASASQTVTLATADGSLAAQTLALSCQAIAAEPRSMGYWKHQVDVYLTGKGSAQETLSQLLGYIELLVEHFNQNLVNPVVVYVPGATTTNDKLLQLQQLLTVNRGATSAARLKQQLLPLLLNVVSGKISQTAVISANGATVSQAITYCGDLMVDANTANDETAKTICDLINNGQSVPSGLVPASTRTITYDHAPAPREPLPAAFGLGPIAPNPAARDATIQFALPSDAPATLEVVDLAGRMVYRTEVGSRGVGHHSIRVGDLKRLAPGIYLVRLSQGSESQIRRLAVIR